MIPFLERAFSKTKKKLAKSFVDHVSTISSLSDEMGKHKKELTEAEYRFILSDKENIFISLSDFLDIMYVSPLSMDMILKICKHRSEIKPEISEVIEIAAIPDGDHIVLCPDPTKCEQHKNYCGKPLRIITAKLKV